MGEETDISIELATDIYVERLHPIGHPMRENPHYGKRALMAGYQRSGRGSGLGAQRGGLGRVAELVEEGGVVLTDGRQVRVLRPERLLVDCDGALEERLGLGEAAGVLVEV